MPLMVGVGAAAVAGPVIGGLMGNMAAKKDRAAQQAAIANAINELNKVGMPPDLSKEIIFQQFSQAGILTPEMEQNIEIASSAIGELEERDPGTRQAQMEALQAMQERGRIGLTAEDRATFNKLRQEVQRDAEAKRQQILQNFAARGQGGSGAELIAALQASQAGADTASEQGDRISSQASLNALQAMQAAGQLGGQVRSQDWSTDAAKAAALDELARFNVQNSMGVQQRNISARNQAQLANLAQKQHIQDVNINQANQELLRQREEQGRLWDRQMALAQAKANAQVGAAGMYGGLAQQKAASAASIGQGVGQAAGGIFGYLAKTPSSTADSPSVSPSEFEAAGGYART